MFYNIRHCNGYTTEALLRPAVALATANFYFFPLFSNNLTLGVIA